MLEDARTPLEIRVLAALVRRPLNRQGIVQRVGHTAVSDGMKKTIAELLRDE